MNLPLGYRYSATYAGIRAQPRNDLALIVSGVPAAAAAVFTQNRVQAAPVKLCRQHLRASRGQVGAALGQIFLPCFLERQLGKLLR